jgi:TrpR family transcriptional regulator, trp operon repressor
MQPLESQCRELARFVLSTSKVEELTHVLKAVLTPAEIESIAQRLSILDGISAGVAQREIAETLRVGIATVTRGSRVWQENRDCLGRYFPRCKEGGGYATNKASSNWSAGASIQSL